jgi:polynucleotide 5'-hydroxyl-kinase GRC3/NOL9
MTDQIHPGAEWDSLFRLLIKKKGIVMMLGMSDSGKSTLVRHLIRMSIKEGVRVSLVDSDVGQSSLGLPGTVSMRVFRNLTDYEEFRPERMFYLGVVNPATAISFLVQTTKNMVDICRRQTDLVFVDTTGLVSGGIGKTMKIAKIRAIRPEWIVAVRKGYELEHILQQSDPDRVIRIMRSPYVKSRSREERLKFRISKLEDYFTVEYLSEFAIRFKGVNCLYRGRPYYPGTGDFRKGMVAGFNSAAKTAGLGTVMEAEGDMAVIRTPLKSIHGIRSLVISDIDLTSVPDMNK